MIAPQTSVHRMMTKRTLYLTIRQKSSSAIDRLLESASWSTKSMLSRPDAELRDVKTLTSVQLDRLLKLSALPQPKNEKARQSILKDLQDQLYFVENVQSINTDGVKPLHNLTAEQQGDDAFAAEEVQSDATSTAYRPPTDYTSLAKRLKNRYFAVDGGLVRDQDSEEDPQKS